MSKFFLCTINQLLIGQVHAVPTFQKETGRIVQVRLHAGDYRLKSTHVIRPNGELHYYVEPILIPEQMDALFQCCNNPPRDVHPLVHAAIAHYNFVRVHPFQDGNGRGARILMNLLLIRAGYMPAVVHLTDCADYYEALQAADGGQIGLFVGFIAKSLLKTLERVLSTAASLPPRSI